MGDQYKLFVDGPPKYAVETCFLAELPRGESVLSFDEYRWRRYIQELNADGNNTPTGPQT